jgi:hypothetical protein
MLFVTLNTKVNYKYLSCQKPGMPFCVHSYEMQEQPLKHFSIGHSYHFSEKKRIGEVMTVAQISLNI